MTPTPQLSTTTLETACKVTGLACQTIANAQLDAALDLNLATLLAFSIALSGMQASILPCLLSVNDPKQTPSFRMGRSYVAELPSKKMFPVALFTVISMVFLSVIVLWVVTSFSWRAWFPISGYRQPFLSFF